MGNHTSERRLASLHFVARAEAQSGKLVHLGGGEWESGNWARLEAVAPLAIGAILHLHEQQDARSWIAGPITGWRPSDTLPGRVVFRFRVDRAHCRRMTEGWGQDQARVWEAPGRAP